MTNSKLISRLQIFANYIWLFIVTLYTINIYFWLFITYYSYYLHKNVPYEVINIFHKFINFDYELNLPSLISTFMLLFCALILLVIAHNWNGKKYIVYAVSIIFFILSFEELLFFHEIIHVYLRGILLFGWLLPGIFIMIIFSYFIINFINIIPDNLKRKTKKAGLVYIFGALGFELICSIYSMYFGNLFIIKKILGATEELIEFFGIFLFITVFLEIIQFQLNRSSITKQ